MVNVTLLGHSQINKNEMAPSYQNGEILWLKYNHFTNQYNAALW